MQKVLDWFRNNSAGASILGVALALMVMGTVMKGCAWEDMIKVPVPREIQKAQGVPATVPLSEATRIFQAQTDAMQAFAKSIEGGYKLMGTLQSFFTAAISQVGTAFPGVGMLLPVLMGVGGVFIKGPGTAREKDKSYTRGLREGEELARKAIAAIKAVTA